MRAVKCIYECEAEVPVPEGNYHGTWDGNSILFTITSEGGPQTCEIKATENKKDLPVMVVVVGPFIYIYDKEQLKSSKK